MSDKQIAWLGLGNMGRGMVANLVSKGNLSKPLIVQNRSHSRSDKLVEALGKDKLKAVETVEEAVQEADIIFSCVGDDAAIKETYQAACEVEIQGKLFVDCSTVLPETTQGLAQLIKSKGGRFLASPVFGAPAAADAGQLVFVFGGPKDLVEEIKPFIKGVMGKAEIHVSEEYGKASELKIIGNSLVMSMVEGLAEAHALADKAGVGSGLHSFVTAMLPGPASAYSTRMTSGDYYKRDEPLFAVDLALKDSSHMLTLADKYGAKMGNVENIRKHLKDVKEKNGKKGDMAGVYGAARVEAGLPFENQ